MQSVRSRVQLRGPSIAIPNNIVEHLVQKEMFLNDEEKSLKRSIEDSFKTLHRLYEDFDKSKNIADMECHNHFAEIRRKIDIYREEVKEKIDEIYMEMIEKTKQMEAAYSKRINNFKSIVEKSLDEEIEELNLKFKDRMSSLDSIKQIKLQQGKDMDTMFVSINELGEIKEFVKRNCKFEPNLTFPTGSLGSLNLNDYQKDPLVSSILKGQQSKELMKLCEFDLNERFRLLYRASEDGFDAESFHLKCDEHANTLTIVKAKKTQFIFGAYTSVSWQTSGGYKGVGDKESFLFSLTNQYNRKMKFKVKPQYHPIYCRSDFGPIFGWDDIAINLNENNRASSFSKLGHHYDSLYESDSEEGDELLAGSRYFQLDEIEVFKKI